MGVVTFKTVVSRAFAEAAEFVRWPKAGAVVTSVVAASGGALATWFNTGQFLVSAAGGLAAVVAFFAAVFLVKLVTVPMALANEAYALLPVGRDDARRDVDLTEALAFATLGEWGQRLPSMEESASRSVSAVLRQFRQLASDNEMTAWGKTNPQGVFERIPAEFWKNHQVELLALLKGEPRTEVATRFASNVRYTDIMVSKSEFERHFPRQ